VKERRVRLTATAARQIEHKRDWWLKNRDHRELFATSLESALGILATLPHAGAPYVHTEFPDLRRLYLRTIDCHVYYTFTDDEVVIRALWGARREHGPKIG
jgi:plasmid stabilization system protein ParE